MVVAILTGHAPVRGHLYAMGLFDGDQTCRFCRKETETVQHIICCCQALARQRYNIFGNPLVETKDISTASVRDLCLFILFSPEGRFASKHDVLEMELVQWSKINTISVSKKKFL